MRSPGPGRQPKTPQRVLVLLRERGIMSRAELARALGLSNSTVSTAIADLVAAGMVIEGGDTLRRAGSAAGRPGRAVSLNPRAGAAVRACWRAPARWRAR